MWCRLPAYAIAEERDFVDKAVSALTVAPSHGRPPVSPSYGASAPCVRRALPRNGGGEEGAQLLHGHGPPGGAGRAGGNTDMGQDHLRASALVVEFDDHLGLVG